MRQREFRIQYLLAVLLPVVFTYFAVQLFYTVRADNATQVSTDSAPTLAGEYGNATPIAINGTLAEKQEKGIDHIWISLALALVAGVAALFGHYIKSVLVWVFTLLLTMVLSLLGAGQMGIGLSLFFLPNLLLGVLIVLIVRHIFFNPVLIRFRMLLTSIAGAIALTLYYRSLYLLTATPFPAPEWQNKAVNALIMFIFITFGLTLADLVVAQMNLKAERMRSRFNISEDDDDDAD
jgi:hypothetical protein